MYRSGLSSAFTGLLSMSSAFTGSLCMSTAFTDSTIVLLSAVILSVIITGKAPMQVFAYTCQIKNRHILLNDPMRILTLVDFRIKSFWIWQAFLHVYRPTANK